MKITPPASLGKLGSMQTVEEFEEIDQELKVDISFDKKMNLEQKKGFLQLKVKNFIFFLAHDK
jgi:hypothetical protein